MLAALLCVLVPALTSGPAAADNYPKNPAVDVVHYAFQVTLSDGTDRIEGVANVTARLLVDGITALRIDLAGPMDGRGGGMTVSAVRVDDQPAQYTHADDVLHVTLPLPSTSDQRITVQIVYAGIPRTGLIIGPNKYGDRTFFSDNWPDKARQWLPTVDHPYDKATSEFFVTAPSHYQVISNGLLVEETDLADGRRLTHWRQSVPIATWLFALGVARFAVQQVDAYQGKPIQTWVYAQDRDAGFYDFAVPTKAVLEFYGDRVGPFAYEKLANVQSNSVSGGMEAATTIFYGDASVTGTRSIRWRNVIIHELAHQWFGNAVTESDWDDVWLSEGFATYFTLLYIEHAYGRDEFLDGLRRSRDQVYAFYRDHPDYRVVHDNLTDMRQVTSSQTYQKGGWTLHMLRGLIGDEAFWRGIRTYYRSHRNANATTDDFRRAMEEASGQSLEWFFQQWLYQGGALVVDGEWHYDAAAGAVVVTLAQVQEDGSLFRMPIEIGFWAADAPRPIIHTIDLSGERSTFTIAVDEEPTRVELDPNLWVLMEARLRHRP
jgi:aminopeptidase N